MLTSVGSIGADEPTKADNNSAGGSLHEIVPTQQTSNNNSNRTPRMDSTETTFKKIGTEDSVDGNVIRVGTFKINGETKHCAVVPPILIRSQPDSQDLVSYWGFFSPNFILETIESNEHQSHFG
jgi:hypothetical protein